MEELFKKFGVPPLMWLVCLFSASLFTLYRIYETEVVPSRRKVVTMLLMGLISALIVPGLVVHWLGIENPSVAAGITGIVVYCFEQVIHIAKGKVLRKISDDEDGNHA